MNLAPFEKSCEPLIKELLSQRSIPLPDNIQEAIYCSAKMFFFECFGGCICYIYYICNKTCYVSALFCFKGVGYPKTLGH